SYSCSLNYAISMTKSMPFIEILTALSCNLLLVLSPTTLAVGHKAKPQGKGNRSEYTLLSCSYIFTDIHFRAIIPGCNVPCCMKNQLFSFDHHRKIDLVHGIFGSMVMWMQARKEK